MENTVHAKLNQGIDSFLRVAMILRRKEIGIKSISMTTDSKQNAGIQLTIDENKTSLDLVINYMNKLHDIEEIEVKKTYM